MRCKNGRTFSNPMKAGPRRHAAPDGRSSTSLRSNVLEVEQLGPIKRRFHQECEIQST